MVLKDVRPIIAELVRLKKSIPLYIDVGQYFPSVYKNTHGEAVRSGLKKALRVIEQAQAVDAVEVVRCDECVCCSMWNDMLICSRIADVMDGYYHGTAEVVKPDDYCSQGIRQRAKPCSAKMDGGAEGKGGRDA